MEMSTGKDKYRKPYDNDLEKKNQIVTLMLKENLILIITNKFKKMFE